MDAAFDQSLRRYAEVIVRVGLNLQPGQRLFVGLSNPIEGAPFVRAVAAEAYRAGARLVDAVWTDDELARLRLRHAPPEALAEFPRWQLEAAREYYERGDAKLDVTGSDPDLLSGADPERVSIYARARADMLRPLQNALVSSRMNWVVAGAATPAWAARVFPDAPGSEAVERLWAAIFAACRVDTPDPVGQWNAHIDDLARRDRYLNARRYAALRYRGPGTDLTVGLADGHQWTSARSLAANGVAFVANIPTEEVFTVPHAERVDGVVTASRPLSYLGQLMDGIVLSFKAGRVVKASATLGEGFLQRLVESDAGAGRLGEVALVPAGSPIARAGHLFFNTLFDENAASHLALGQGIRFAFQHARELTDEDYAQAGCNDSQIHVDFMIGSPHLDVDGVRADGAVEPLMRAGEWAFAA
jgi:aminopeptidase